jgi:hypothetical protein
MSDFANRTITYPESQKNPKKRQKKSPLLVATGIKLVRTFIVVVIYL